jgi:hypothetical protein
MVAMAEYASSAWKPVKASRPRSKSPTSAIISGPSCAVPLCPAALAGG